MQQLRDHARAIWDAAVSAVRSERLTANVLQRTATSLIVCGEEFRLEKIERIAVVGAGKAGAGMAAAVEEALGDDLVREKVVGWINVPSDCVRRLKKIELHAARPAGVNEPTAEGVAGSLKILNIVSHLQPNDLCLVLLSGGGSALLPAPAAQITLADKLAVTRLLMHSGATINELNTVRKQLSQIKGGRLARASRAGRTVTLIISDVVGDPLDIIASGPTVPDTSTPADALAVLRKYAPDVTAVLASALDYLTHQAAEHNILTSFPSTVSNHVIGNNAVALEAATQKARELGYAVRSLGSNNQGVADDMGRELVQLCLSLRDHREPVSPPVCVLSGGEPVVHFAPSTQPRKGGRNQQLVLSAVNTLWNDGMSRIAVLSGGTDGEDGPTDAAGAVADGETISAAKLRGLNPADFLGVQNAYPFFDAVQGLIRTGPTHTNVMDVRVALVSR